MNTSLISVIVPVYKVEKYLSKCIDSILAQTYENFELLLIDDGSPDNSGKICDEYATKDSRIKVFHKENSGVSSARNLGLDNATGEWVCFVDSDDCVDPIFLENFNIKDNCADLYISGHHNTDCCQILSSKEYVPIYCNTLKSIGTEYENQKLCYSATPWAKLYKTDIINKNYIRFNERVTLGEDTIFLFQFFMCITSLEIVKGCHYNYLYTEPNSLNRRLSAKVHTYESHIESSIIDDNLIKKLSNHITLSSEVKQCMLNIFVYQRRLLALTSLMLRPELYGKRFYLYKQEVEFWQAYYDNSQIYSFEFNPRSLNKLHIMCKVRPLWLSYLVMYVSYKLRKLQKNLTI